MFDPIRGQWTRIRALALTMTFGLAACSDSDSTGLDAGTPPAFDDPYADLETLAVQGNSVTVGSAGGIADFGSYALEIPRGALATDTMIQARVAQTSPFPAVYGEALAPVLEFLPSGLEFELPLKLTIELDRDPPAPLIDSAGYFMVSTDLEGTGIEDVGLNPAESRGRAIKAWLSHFSHVGAYAMPGSGPSVRDIAAAGCTTGPVAGLSEEIRSVFVTQQGVGLERVRLGGGIVLSDGPQTAAWATAGLGMSLESARAMRPRAAPILFLNATWRSVAQQYVLGRCGNANTVADVGLSRHLVGAAIDAQSRARISAACRMEEPQTRPDKVALRDRLHPVWGALLEGAGGFAWYGTEASDTCALPRNMRAACPCDDPPHFEHVDSRRTDQRAQAVRAFQILWERRNPCAPIPSVEIGQTTNAALPTTLEYLASSPAAGFGSTTPIMLPVEDAGCAAPQLCCPANSDQPTPYCADDCDSASSDAGVEDSGPPDASQPADGGEPEDGGGVTDAGTSTTAPYTLTPDPAPQYPDSGNELQDGNINFGLDWVDAVAWFNTNPEIVLDFGQARSLSSYEIYVGNSEGDGEYAVYRPDAAEVLTSTDGVAFTSVGLMGWSVHSLAGDKYQVDLGSAGGARTARYVKFAITYGPDVRSQGGSWVHVSEVRAY